MRKIAAIVLVGSVVAALPDRAMAQSVFVSGTVFANVMKFGGFRSDSPFVDNTDMSGTTTGGALGVGGYIGDHVAIQVEFAVPEDLNRSFDPPRFLPPLQQPPTGTRREVTMRTRHGAILGGYTTDPDRRVSAALLGGVMFFHEKTRTISEIVGPVPPFPPLPPGIPRRSDTTIRYYRAAAVFGLDLNIIAVSRLSVVPQLRVYRSSHSGLGALGLWPGLSIRWTF